MITHGALTPHAQPVRPCSRCLEPRLLLARVGKLDLCAVCWRKAGAPFPLSDVTPEQVMEAHNAIRKSMTARGGTGRHMVRNGRT